MNTKSILAFDCACVGGTVALRVGDVTTALHLTQGKEAAELISTIDGLLNSHGVAYASLAAIVSTVGPGSFTGVRIGLAALHGLALAHPVPIKTITTLEAMAWAVARLPDAPSAFHIALRAGKGEVYAQKFSLNITPAPPQGEWALPSALNAIELHPETFTAWDAPCYGNHLAPTDAHHLPGPDAAVLCAIADHLPTTTLAEALPVYIRPPDAIAAQPLPWLRP
jgi:tRNA threonylcarbamoyladenosine biosynthesis protein TsaB